MIGTKITGQTSGISAVVDKVLLAEDSERGQLTLYINYLTSNTSNNSTQIFSDGEELICSEIITSVSEEMGSKLLNNPKRICWPDSHIPMSAPLEKEFYPSKERLINEIKSTLIN